MPIRKDYFYCNFKLNNIDMVAFSFNDTFTDIDMIITAKKFQKMYPLIKATYNLKLCDAHLIYMSYGDEI